MAHVAGGMARGIAISVGEEDSSPEEAKRSLWVLTVSGTQARMPPERAPQREQRARRRRTRVTKPPEPTEHIGHIAPTSSHHRLPPAMPRAITYHHIWHMHYHYL